MNRDRFNLILDSITPKDPDDMCWLRKGAIKNIKGALESDKFNIITFDIFGSKQSLFFDEITISAPRNKERYISSHKEKFDSRIHLSDVELVWELELGEMSLHPITHMIPLFHIPEKFHDDLVFYIEYGTPEFDEFKEYCSRMESVISL